ncbi:RHS repeat-associated core domain-containing protein [Luteibacter sp. CQ10]
MNLGFPGQYFDDETKTWNNGFRDYRADLGRYVESDPTGLVGGVNTYAYVEANPSTAVDLLGLATVVLVGNGTVTNPFGHVALAFTGKGVFSHGTGTKFGSSLTTYLEKQGQYRSTTAYVINTTPEQEKTMMDYMNDEYSERSTEKCSILSHDCATAVNGALSSAKVGDELVMATAQAGGILLNNLPSTSATLARSFPGASVLQIPQGGSVPSSLGAFNP